MLDGPTNKDVGEVKRRVARICREKRNNSGKTYNLSESHLKKHSHFSCPIQSKAEKKQALQFELNRLKIHSVVVRLASRLGTQTAT